MRRLIGEFVTLVWPAIMLVLVICALASADEPKPLKFVGVEPYTWQFDGSNGFKVTCYMPPFDFVPPTDRYGNSADFNDVHLCGWHPIRVNAFSSKKKRQADEITVYQISDPGHPLGCDWTIDTIGIESHSFDGHWLEVWYHAGPPTALHPKVEATVDAAIREIRKDRLMPLERVR